MKIGMFRSARFGGLVAILLGCGGSEAPAEVTTTGDEETAPPMTAEAPVEEEVWEEPEPEPEPVRTGQLMVTIRMGGEDQPGTVEVQDADGETVAQSTSGETMTLPVGSYQVIATMEESLLPGHGSLEDSVTVRDGRMTDKRMTYEVARVRITVRRRGRPVSRWSLSLTREGGDTELTLEPSETHTIVAPGRYSGVLTAGGQRVEVTGLIFQPGTTMDVPVTVN
ncbi:MAG: hypothetical protein AAF938_10195 [Myxococcota bacterium]